MNISHGAWQGDVKKLTDDVAALKPSLFVAVPRVLERIQSGIVAKLKKKPWIVRFIFNIAYKLKSSAVRGGKPVEKVSPHLHLVPELSSVVWVQQHASNMSYCL